MCNWHIFECHCPMTLRTFSISLGAIRLGYNLNSLVNKNWIKETQSRKPRLLLWNFTGLQIFMWHIINAMALIRQHFYGLHPLNLQRVWDFFFPFLIRNWYEILLLTINLNIRLLLIWLICTPNVIWVSPLLSFTTNQSNESRTILAKRPSETDMKYLVNNIKVRYAVILNDYIAKWYNKSCHQGFKTDLKRLF